MFLLVLSSLHGVFLFLDENEEIFRHVEKIFNYKTLDGVMLVLVINYR